MDFAESAEHRDLRAAVASIASGFGPRYYASHASTGTPCDELWAKLGEAGFIGVNILAEYGGGGGGLTELALVCEETRRAGLPRCCCSWCRRPSPPGCSVSSAPRRSARRGCPGWPPGPARWCSRSPSRTRARTRTGIVHHRHPGRGRLGAARHQVLHLRGGRGRGAAGGHAHRRPADGGNAELSLFLVPTPTRRGWRRGAAAGRDLMLPEKQFTLHFDDVRVGPEALVGDEGQGFRQVFDGGLNPERIMGPRRSSTRRAAGRRSAARLCARAGGVGTADRCPPGRGAPARRGQGPAAARPADDPEGLRAVRQRRTPARGSRRTWPSTPPPRPAIHCVDSAIQAHGGNGFAARVRTERPVVGGAGRAAPRRSRARWSSTTSPSTRSGCPSPTEAARRAPAAGPAKKMTCSGSGSREVLGRSRSE